jgi:hypothetical protein
VATSVALFVLWALVAAAGKPEPVPADWADHAHPTGTFAFRAPGNWSVGGLTGRKDVFQASGPEGLVWFLYRRGESGFDSLHVSCMAERLSERIDASPRLRYEYDMRTAPFGDRLSLDSAFVVTYDLPVLGQHEWRERTLTIVGAGESLCVVVQTPLVTWKKSKDARRTLDGIVQSITFRPRP